MSGIFTGVGTGPGDPELMTLKAVKVIRACSVIALPVSDPTLEKPVYEAAGRRKEEQGNAAGPDGCAAGGEPAGDPHPPGFV